MSAFCITVQEAPYSGQAALSAYNFVKAALAAGHQINRLFFHEGGVLNGSSLIVPAQDELNLPLAWQKLINEHQLDAVICISSALKYGVVSATESERYELSGTSLLQGFTISGLAQWVDGVIQADRQLCFKN